MTYTITIDTSKTQKAIGEQLWKDLDLADDVLQPTNDILPIVIQSSDTQTLQLPWELLYHSTYGSLATNPQFTLSRQIPDVPILQTPFEKKPLRVLFFSTLPDDLQESERLAVENEQVAVLEALLPAIKEGKVELQIPNDGRFESLKHHIEKFDPHLVFLSGHSGYDKGKGSFLFEDKRGFKVDIDEEQLTTAFIGSHVSCVVLSSCQSAKADKQRLNSGLFPTF
ncbi:CHAT domain-containing protein [Sulfurovum sp. bin170]|uniref:CHAT domain-containing protein n=1 Tax=Sulfurovum sp. bin170 TaxID=2695268 RepID=UPI0013DFA368|nr:CHAT domain-containing protein [Sulfurovum sp. bin170]NEW61757.1 CHAT domain-containing protein [Sulfurovum sp. bin170]